MYCPKCGHKNEDSAKYCMGCGQALTAAAADSPWRSAGSIPGEEQRIRPETPVQPVYSPPVSTGVHNVAPIVIEHTRKSAASKWLIPVIIIATLAIVATILFSTAKKCENCGKMFWGESHYFLGYTICDDCWH